MKRQNIEKAARILCEINNISDKIKCVIKTYGIEPLNVDIRDTYGNIITTVRMNTYLLNVVINMMDTSLDKLEDDYKKLEDKE